MGASGAGGYGAGASQGRRSMIHPTDEGGLKVSKGGPATQEGKEGVRWNAVRHGIRSPAPVVPGVEKKEDWEEHRDGVVESLSPEGHLEEVLAERVALLLWRVHCGIRYEGGGTALSPAKGRGGLTHSPPPPFL